tara:strand:+ start:6999 stop:7451 length:453 start_codon:yes stop_codon:yes gene_type:complete
MKKRKAGTRPSRKKNLGKFKSGIEKYCNDQLRAAGLEFGYEEKEYLLMDKFRYPNRYLKMTAKRKDLTDRSNSIQLPIRYTPDFVAKDGSWVIETKGYLHSHHDFPMRWKLFLHHLVENNMDCAVYIAKNRYQIDRVIEDIKSLQNGRTE